MSEKQLDIPAFSFFEQGNIFTGSCRTDFRYRIEKQDDALVANVWHKDVCFEQTETETYTFSANAEGLAECVAKLAECAEGV